MAQRENGKLPSHISNKEERMKKIARITAFLVSAVFVGLVFSSNAGAKGGGPPPTDRYGEVSMPSWNSTGDRVAFVYTLGDDSEIYIAKIQPGKVDIGKGKTTDMVAGIGLKNVSKNKAADTNPLWSPDGASLLFISRRDSKAEIYKVNKDGVGRPKKLTGKINVKTTNAKGVTVTAIKSTKSDAARPVWSPKGDTIVYVGYENGHPQLYSVPSDGGAADEFLYPDTADYPSFSSDGKQLAVSAAEDIIIFDVKTGKPNNITLPLIEGNMVDDSIPFWSPKGTRLAFVGRYEAFSTEIYTIEGSGKSIRRITDNLFEDFAPGWQAKDRKSVV